MIDNSSYSLKTLAIDTSAWVDIQNSLLSNKTRPTQKTTFSYKTTNMLGTEKLEETIEKAILNGYVCVSSEVYAECMKLLEEDNFIYKLFDKYKEQLVKPFNKNQVGYLSKLQSRAKFSSPKKISEPDLELCMLAKEQDYVVITQEKHTTPMEEFKKIPNFCEANRIEWGNTHHFMTFLLHLSHQ